MQRLFKLKLVSFNKTQKRFELLLMLKIKTRTRVNFGKNLHDNY